MKRHKCHTCCIFMSSVLLVAGLAYGRSTSPQANIRFTEIVLSDLGPVPSGVKEVIVNDTGTLAVSMAERNQKQYFVINGKEGPLFDWVTRSSFTADGKHVHYIGNRGGERDMSTAFFPKGGEWFSVVDNEASPAFDSVEELVTATQPKPIAQPKPEPAWQSSSRDGKRTASVSRGPRKWFMVIDGKADQLYDWVAWPVFSPDGRRFAYVAYQEDQARPSGRHFVVIDGKAGPVYDNVDGSSLSFSPDSKQLAYRAQRIENGVWYFPVINNKEGKISPAGYQSQGPVFSQDSRLVAYSTWRDGKDLVIVSGVESQLYEKVWLPKRQDGAKIRFFGLNKGKIYAVEARAD